jgi:hypothetical protein
MILVIHVGPTLIIFPGFEAKRIDRKVCSHLKPKLRNGDRKREREVNC